MNGQCPKCEARFNIDDSKIPDDGIYGKCPKCQERIFISKTVSVAINSEAQSIQKSIQSTPLENNIANNVLISSKTDNTQTSPLIKKSYPKEKSLALAIGLNFFLPGIGYIYMGKIALGIVAIFLVIGIYLQASIFTLFFTWITMNVIMAIDMVILGNKNKKEYEEATLFKCPHCAEMIKKEALVCKHCGKEVKYVEPKVVIDAFGNKYINGVKVPNFV